MTLKKNRTPDRETESARYWFVPKDKTAKEEKVSGAEIRVNGTDVVVPGFNQAWTKDKSKSIAWQVDEKNKGLLVVAPDRGDPKVEELIRLFQKGAEESSLRYVEQIPEAIIRNAVDEAERVKQRASEELEEWQLVWCFGRGCVSRCELQASLVVATTCQSRF